MLQTAFLRYIRCKTQPVYDVFIVVTVCPRSVFHRILFARNTVRSLSVSTLPARIRRRRIAPYTNASTLSLHVHATPSEQ